MKMLSMYSWPGNVRQLKSLIERICVYEDGKEITEEIIKNYIPNDTVLSTSLVAANNTENSSLNSMLVDMIKKLFNEVNELKKKIKDFESPQHAEPANIIAQHDNNIIEAANTNILESKPLHTAVANLLEVSEPKEEVSFSKVKRSIISPRNNFGKHISQMADEEPKYNLVEVESSDEEFKSLEEIEKEAIEMALLRNNGKRKITAEQLKISERTLYRKIEEYKLNDNNYD